MTTAHGHLRGQLFFIRLTVRIAMMLNLSVFLTVIHLLVIPAYLLGMEHRTEAQAQNTATISLPIDEVHHHFIGEPSAFEGN